MTAHKMLFITALFLFGCIGCVSEEGGYRPLPSSGISTPAVDQDAGTDTGTTTTQHEPTPEEWAAVCSLECPPAPAGEQGPAGVPGTPGQDGTSCTVAAVPEGAAVTCGAQSVVVHSGSVGPAGPAGERGETGATGAVGPRGAAGPAGAVGATGAQGPAGTPGSDGLIDTSLLYERSDTGWVTNDTNSFFAWCDSGDVVITGGCLTTSNGSIRSNWPDTSSGASLPDGWHCRASASGTSSVTVKAICMVVD